jgi:hypothetical protein
MALDAAALKLRAEDSDDLAVLSACLQDALVLVGDFAFAPEDKSFMLLANRFRWENGLRPAPGERGNERILCGIAFSEVAGVSYRGFRRSDSERILSLLAIRPRPGRDGGYIDLEFATGATLRLEVGRILCHLKDLGEPWPTPWQPDHDAEGPA